MADWFEAFHSEHLQRKEDYCVYECIQYTWLILNKSLGFKHHRLYEGQTYVPILSEATEFRF